jgi:hypothetical protein
MSDEPVYYNAEEAGKIIHQSANWMKTQARAGNIPFSQVGRQKLWTAEHLAAILRAGERKPSVTLVPKTPTRRRAAEAVAPTLQAKPQRRRGAA